ncbi:hypothetical protein V1264_024642 [Littorina saxatilis]|uniref:Uncharacterized protein n=2 Tax=Littorina saxatilis TaxID=31220 RepID=A0AAN9AMX4_9CAEN
METLAECPPCEDTNICSCDVTSDDFKVGRTGTSSTLQLVGGNDRQKDGATLTCSEKDSKAPAECQLKTLYYTLPQCRNGQLHISEAGKRLPITCDGVGPGHNVNWTLTDDSGHVTPLAFCNGSGNCTANDDITASRTDNASTLSILDITGLKDKQTLTCVRGNGGTMASCLIRTFNDDPDPFPWVVVGVVVGAAVLVIIIVIVIAIVVAKRRASRQDAVENNLEQNAADDEFEEHINDLYQSSNLDTPPLADQCPPTSAQAFHLQAYSTAQVSNTVNADPNGIQQMTQTAQSDDVYNVLGSAPRGDQKADPVYNHLTKF